MIPPFLVLYDKPGKIKIEMYLKAFLLSFFLSLFLTFLVKFLAFKFSLFDQTGERKIHKFPTPRIGGIAIFLAFLISVFLFLPISFRFWISPIFVSRKHVGGLILGAILIFLIGLIDDLLISLGINKKGLSPWIKLFFQFISAIIIVSFGIGIDFLTNPFGGLLFLDQIKLPINLFGITYHFVLFADLLSILWILVIVNVVNFLDGIDGLATGVGIIGSGVIFLLSILPHVNQPLSAILAIILLGALLGFFPFNFPFPSRSKIFLGDSGAYFLGFVLAVLAIISGAKLATVFLVLGLPIFDGIWTIGSRIKRKISPFKAGKDHFHHKLLSLGLSTSQILLFFYFISALFGLIALISNSFQKFVALGILLISLTIIMIFVSRKIARD